MGARLGLLNALPRVRCDKEGKSQALRRRYRRAHHRRLLRRAANVLDVLAAAGAGEESRAGCAGGEGAAIVESVLESAG